LARSKEVDALKEGVLVLLESGLPQQALGTARDISLSMIQAGANNPWMAYVVGTIGIELAGKMGILSDTNQNVLEVAGGVYMTAAAVGKALTASESTSVTFDIPDVQTPRLAFRPRKPLLIPKLGAGPVPPPFKGKGSPVPVSRPLQEPIVRPGPGPIEVPFQVVDPEQFQDPSEVPISAAQETLSPGEIAAATAAGLGAAAVARVAFAGGGVQSKPGPGLQLG